jgi:hypothetical protein
VHSVNCVVPTEIISRKGILRVPLSSCVSTMMPSQESIHFRARLLDDRLLGLVVSASCVYYEVCSRGYRVQRGLRLDCRPEHPYEIATLKFGNMQMSMKSIGIRYKCAL